MKTKTKRPGRERRRGFVASNTKGRSVKAAVIEEIERAKVPRAGEFTCCVDGRFLRTRALCEIEAATAAAMYVDSERHEEGVFRVKVIRCGDNGPVWFNITRRIEYTASLLR